MRSYQTQLYIYFPSDGLHLMVYIWWYYFMVLFYGNLYVFISYGNERIFQLFGELYVFYFMETIIWMTIYFSI